MKLKLLILLLLLTSAPIHAANRVFCRIREFTPSTGLTQGHISNTLTDNQGFLWFATWNGLVRYDGYNFYTFKPTMYSGGSIVTNRIFNLKLDTEGNIWCVSLDNHLYHFDTRLCMFTDVSTVVKDVSHREVRRVQSVDKGVTWVSFSDGACLRLTDRDFRTSWQFFPPGKLLPKGGKLNKVRQNKNGDEWLLGNKEAVNYTRNTRVKGNYKYAHEAEGKTYLVANDGLVVELTGRKITSRIRPWEGENSVGNATTRGGYTAIASDRGLAILKTGRKLSLHFMPIDGEKVRDTHFDRHGRLWAFTDDSRVTLIDPRQRTVKILDTKPSPGTIRRNNPQIMFEDEDGCVILKPVRGTLSVYDEQSGQLLPVTTYDGSTTSVMPDMEIKRSLVDHQKNLWIFQKDRTTRISFTHEMFRHATNPSALETRAMLCDALGRKWLSDRSNALYLSSAGQPTVYMQPTGTFAPQAAPFTHGPMYCITEDSRHRIWIGTKGDGLYLLTPDNQARTSYRVQHISARTPGSGLSCDSVYAITADTQGNIWIGTYGKGLYRADGRSDGMPVFREVPMKEEYKRIRSINTFGGHVLLISTTGGLVTADSRKARPDMYYNTYRKEEWGLKGTDVMQTVVLGGKVYLCVFGEGVSEVTSANLLSSELHFRNTPIPTSSAADQIMNAATDGRNIWIVSEEAIVSFNPASRRYCIFDRNDFGHDIAFSEATPIMKGRIMTVGTHDGTIAFDTSTPVASSPGRVVFTGIQYQNDMNIRPLNDITSLTIEPEQRSFSLYLSSLDFSDIRNTRYRYFLEGYDKNWNYVDDGQHSVNYSNLPAGKYRLKVQATDTNGTWDKNGRTIEVVVTPLFTETVWFKMVVMLIIAAVLAGMVFAIVYLNKVRQVLQRKYSLLMTVEELGPKVVPTTQKPRAEDDKDRIIRGTVEYLGANITQSNILVDEIARTLGMSRTGYYTHLKEATGLSPSDFIRQFRIRQALKLLDKGGMSVAEVAFAVGFTDPKYFTKCFKAEMEMTPTQYLQSKEQAEEQN